MKWVAASSGRIRKLWHAFSMHTFGTLPGVSRHYVTRPPATFCHAFSVGMGSKDKVRYLNGMADIFTKEQRSKLMSSIRSRGNKDTEVALMMILRAAGIKGWNRHVEVRIKKVPAKVRGTKYEVRSLPGSEGRGAKSEVQAKRKKGKAGRISDLSLRTSQKPRPFKVRPDFVWRRERVAVFVDGCFWHGCPWHGTKPSSNKSFWREKLARNRARDQLVTRTLRKAGWKVLRIWEHTLPRAARDAAVLGKLLERVKKLMVES